MRAGRAVLTRTAVALVDIDVTVAGSVGRCLAPRYSALSCVLNDEIVLTNTICKPSHTRAPVRVQRDDCTLCRLSASATVGTRRAGTLVNVYITVATP